MPKNINFLIDLVEYNFSIIKKKKKVEYNFSPWAAERYQIRRILVLLFINYYCFNNEGIRN